MVDETSKVLLLILDGWGLNREYEGNAISQAKTPFFDQLWQEQETAVLEASGETVGLPQGQMGTSEVNHFTIGAGQVVFQDLVRINKAIDNGTFMTNPALVEACQIANDRDSTLHIFGLLSDGGVHSHQEHIFALLEIAQAQKVSNVVLHVITDGRDTSPHGGEKYLQQLQTAMDKTGVGRIGSIGGRYFAMDRDKNWDRTDKYFDVVSGKNKNPQTFTDVHQAIRSSYNNNVTDEYVEPAMIQAPTGQDNHLRENDVVVVANFRVDRPRQVMNRLLAFEHNLHVVTMTQYMSQYEVSVAFPPPERPISFGQVISDAGIKQLRITETEKFPHVTYFFNCQHQDQLEGEDHYMFDSYSDVPTHDKKPQMRTPDIADAIVDDIESGHHQVIISNLCNADMVGHTGNIPAAAIGCETVDAALAKIIPVAKKHGFTVLITADHGNAEEMSDEETKQPITSHTLNPVPLIMVQPDASETKRAFNRNSGTLIDIAPTMLELLGIDAPGSMTGESFLTQEV